MANTNRLNVNKHYLDESAINANVFSNDEYRYGEIVICNDIEKPGLYIYTKLNDASGSSEKIQKINSVENIYFNNVLDDKVNGDIENGDSIYVAISKLKKEITNIINGDEGLSDLNGIVGKIIATLGINKDGTFDFWSELPGLKHVKEAKSFKEVIEQLDDAIDSSVGDVYEYLESDEDGGYKKIIKNTILDELKELNFELDAADGYVITGIKQDNGKISATTKELTIDRDESGLVYTFNLGGVKYGEINIPKDQFLNEAKFIESATITDVADALNYGQVIDVNKPYLKFVWILGEEKNPTYVDVSGLVDVYNANDIPISDDFTGTTESVGIEVGDSVESAIEKIVEKVKTIIDSQKSDKVKSKGGSVIVEESADGTSLDINVDNDTIVKDNSVPKYGQLSVSLKVDTTTYEDGGIKAKHELVTESGKTYGTIYETRDVICGDSRSYVTVTKERVSAGENIPINTDKNTIILNVAENIGSAIGPTVENGNGLTTAWAVKQYVTNGTFDGDVINVGKNEVLPWDKWVGRIQFYTGSSHPSSDYDTIHKAFLRTDNNFIRLAESLGFEGDGENCFKYPSWDLTGTTYIKDTENVFDGLVTLDESLSVFSGAVVDALSNAKVNATSDKETIIISEHSDDTNTSFDVNVHEATTENVSSTIENVISTDKNFLEQDSTSDKGLKVSGMDSDVTVTTAPIKILGWSDRVGSGVYKNWDGTDVSETADGTGINYIPKGTSIQEILENILSLVNYPNAATKPTISISLSPALSGLKEIHSTVTIPGATLSKNVGKFNASYTNVTQPTPQITWSGDEITTTKTGFTNYTLTTGATIVSASTTVDLGSNGVKYSAKSTYSEPTNSPVRNDNEPTTKTGKTAADKTATWSSANASATAQTTITGVYPVFNNISGGALIADATNKMALTSAATITIENVPAEGDNHLMFDFPNDRTVSSFKVKNLSGNYVDYTGAWNATETVQKNVNGTSYTYSRLTTTGGAQGAGVSYQITLSKSLNQ